MDKLLFEQQQQYLAKMLGGSTVTVSGATGLIGSRIVKYMLELNKKFKSSIKIKALYRNEEKFQKVYENFSGREDLTPVFFDGKSDLSGSTDYIIHSAGISGGTKMHIKDPVKIFEIAYEGTRDLLNFAAQSGCKRFCYVSTYEMYGTPEDGHPLTENEPCLLDTMSIRDSYSECKRMCESMCVAYSLKYGFDVMCGRLTSTFGYGVKYDDPRFFAEFARCVAEGRDIVLKSSGGTVRTYLDSDDAASAFLYILVKGENLNVYNVTNMDNAISIREIAEKVIELSKTSIKLKFDVSDDISNLGYRKEGCTLIDANKLYAIGWKPSYNLDDTIIKLIREFLKGENKYV